MANTCFNIIKIEGNKETLSTLKTTIDKLIDNLTVRNTEKYLDAGIDDLLSVIGYTPEELENISRREWVTGGHPKLEDDILTIRTESAWRFQGEAWELVKKKYPDVNIHYQAEELGCEIFETNDTEGRLFKDKYLLDWYDERKGDGEMEYFETEEDLTDYVRKNIAPDVRDREGVDKALEEINEEDDSFANLYEIDYQEGYALAW